MTDRTAPTVQIYRPGRITSWFEEWTRTLELVSDPVAHYVLSKKISLDLAGRGIDVFISNVRKP